MTVEVTGQRQFQFSLRSILVVTAMVAILLVPLAWVTRERQQMIRAREEVLRAREEAVRAVVLAERAARETADAAAIAGSKSVAEPPQSARTNQPAGLVERLQRENAELKVQVETLRREVERLKAANRRGLL
jgi:predicted RNase H-like nuclease (RuvC/YqgF family)